MILCVQRVLEASVKVDNVIMGAIGKGLHVLVGIESGDSTDKVDKLAEKVCNLRIFPDDSGKMSLSVKDINGEILIVSQFTLAGDTSKGSRPDFGNAEKPERAEMLYDEFTNSVRKIISANKVATGVFGADMKISLLNDGPVTLILKR